MLVVGPGMGLNWRGWFVEEKGLYLNGIEAVSGRVGGDNMKYMR